MTGHFVLRSTTLATAFLLFATGAAHAACSIDEASASPTTDEVLPTMDPGQGFSVVATGDCRTLVFSVQDTTLTKIPTRGPGPPTDRTYRVFLTQSELGSVIDRSTTILTWSITAYGPGGLPLEQVTTTNEIDLDYDGWTRSDGDVGKCDLSSTINPGVDETCNNVDDNCSGDVDEDLCRPSGRDSYVCSGGVWEWIYAGGCPR
jgi:hypothetical protein